MLPSIIRTVVPMIVAVALGQAAKIGLDLPSGAVTDIVTVLIGFVYYAAIRTIEQDFPAVGRWLLALGFTSKQPTYTRTGASS